MQKVIIEGPVTLKGEVNISGSKNASLPIMISTVLSKGSCLISNVPNLRDTRFLVSILQDLGCKVDFQKNIFAVHNSSIKKKISGLRVCSSDEGFDSFTWSRYCKIPKI